MKVKYFIPSIITMILIFFFSAQTGSESAALSNGFLLWIQQTLNISIPSLLIRKCAHMSEYAILMFTFLYGFKKNNIKHSVIYAFLSTVLYAFTDEFHQLFVENRSGSMIDVFIDSLGAVITTLLYKIKKSLHTSV